MEYKKLDKPIYWMGWQKGRFTKRKFVEYQAAFPRYLRDTEGNVRYFSKEREKTMNEIHCVGSYSKYSYDGFTDMDEIEFLKDVVKRNEGRIHREQKKIDMIERETNKIIDIIRQKEENK